MFTVTEVTDMIEILPSYFNGDGYETVSYLLENKFCNKVIAGVGLCITVYDVDKIYHEDSETLFGSGTFTKVDFRVVVFRPFLGEIIEGTIKYCVKNYVKVTLDFFDDIIIYSDQLPQPIRYLAEDKMFLWSFNQQREEEEGTNDTEVDESESKAAKQALGKEAQEERKKSKDGEEEENVGFYVCPGQKIRLRVTEINYDDDVILSVDEPVVEEEEEAKALAASTRLSKQTPTNTQSESSKRTSLLLFYLYQYGVEIVKKRKAMVVLGTAAEMGLGPTEWWHNEEPQVEEAAIEQEQAPESIGTEAQ